MQVAFNTDQVRPLTGPPPKIAILNVTPPPTKKTASNVMYQYAVAAGLSWPCNGNGDCAGGLGPGCNKAGVLAYLASPGGDTAIPQVCTPSGSSFCAPNFNTGPGLIYDILCDNDFVPPAAGTSYTDTQLAKGNYKLLWIPHWDTSGTTPTGSTDPSAVVPLPPTSASDTLAWQLKTISGFVDAGNNLFVECLGIQALEGIAAEDNANGKPVGVPATRFQSPNGILKWNGTGGGTLTLQPIIDPTHPDMQVGDFSYLVVSGAITTYFPDTTSTVATAYRSGNKRLITEAPSTTPPPSWDVSSTIQVVGSDGATKGSVAYLGGHDYSPKVGQAPGSTGQTAGTRIVLNTLFNLGFACADPNTTCNTGLLGECATGALKCASGGGLQCVGKAPGALLCGSGKDNDCNGVIDDFEDGCNVPACTNGATRSCYDGPAGTAGVGPCVAGTQTCTGGIWGACAGQVLPKPEVCNGKDDDCKNGVDDGNLCGSGFSCTGGLCLPTTCNAETLRCPSGFTCSATTSTCDGVPCPSAPCAAGLVCLSGQCADPCASITCGPGSSCSGGQCVAGGCALTGCAAGQACVSGSCVTDPCAGNACPTGTFCRLGDCVRSCAYVGCAPGQSCDTDGFCQPDCSPACGAGQVCDAGACMQDPCAGVLCGAGQECRAGACVDAACGHVSCPLGANAPLSCEAGQCVGGGITTSKETPIHQPKSSGGCGTGGAGDLASLLAALGALWTRRRSLAAALARRAGVAGLLAAVALVGAGCKGNAATSCSAGQVACGTDCADLRTSTLHCGACGHGCASGFQCVAASCVYPTGTPFLESVDPSTVGLGAAPPLHLAGEGFQAGAVLRVSGIGRTQELPLTIAGPTSATLPAGSIDLSGAAVGTGELPVLNPGRLVSNAAKLAVIDALVLRVVTPAVTRQDGSDPVLLKLIGFGFAPGAVVSLAAAGGAPQALPTTYVNSGEVDSTAPAPGTLAVGHYGVTVTNPGGVTSAAVVFTVTEGAPVLSSVSGTSGTCVQQSATFSGSVAGSFLYPTSVVRVSGGSIADTPLTTSCLSGTDPLGQCAGGQLRVSADLTPVPLGFYDVSVVNPGSPSALRSATQTIQLQISCP